MDRVTVFFRKYSVPFILAGLFLLFFVLSYLSKGTYGGADDFVHYRFARWSFVHPYLFLDHWAKPVFTILASPFAQFGFMGIKTFNLILGLATAYFTYRVCKNLELSNSWLSIILVCFAPVYLSMLLSGMTEILFSFTLILATILAIRNHLVWSALLLSLLPFVRNEGIVVIPFFMIYFLMHRKYLTIPALFAGFVFFSILGYGYYHDLLWLIHKMPYTGAKDIYGSGPLLHFVNNTKLIFGIPLTILFFLGLIVLVYRLYKQNFGWHLIATSSSFRILLLIFLPFLAYFATHSILWWQGWGGSYGLTRVMAGVVPLFVIVAMFGISYTLHILRKNWTKTIVLVVVLYLTITTPFLIFKFPVPLDDGQKTTQEAAIWVKKNGFQKQCVYYYNSFFCFTLDEDPYDKTKVWEGVPDRNIPGKGVTAGSIIVWDAHFSAVEGSLPLEPMMNDSLLKLIKVFRPEHPFLVDGGKNYEVCIFQRRQSKSDWKENYLKYKEASEQKE